MISTLSDFIAQVETNNVPEAIRFEPGFAKYVTDTSLRACIDSAGCTMSRDTARNVLQTSWGRHQIMGENVYALGYRGNIIRFATDVQLQDLYFSRYCESRSIAYSLSEVLFDLNLRQRFAKKYNGSFEYAVSMRNKAITLGLLNKGAL